MVVKTQRLKRWDELPDFCALADVSDLLGISRATAYRMAGQGKLPCIRIGKRIIFSKEHLKQWLDREINIYN